MSQQKRRRSRGLHGRIGPNPKWNVADVATWARLWPAAVQW